MTCRVGVLVFDQQDKALRVGLRQRLERGRRHLGRRRLLGPIAFDVGIHILIRKQPDQLGSARRFELRGVVHRLPALAAKGGDYFQLMDIPLYDRVGGDKAMEVVTDLFYQKVLNDDLVSRFFEDTDMEKQRLKQKSFLSMAFGGPYHYSDLDLRAGHKPLIEKYGLSDVHFNRIMEIFKETLTELNISANELQGMMEILESMRDAVLNR